MTERGNEWEPLTVEPDRAITATTGTAAMADRDSDIGPHEFGGDWTGKKLDILRKYLEAYAQALANKPSPERPFRKAYIDAFAGTGYRTPTTSTSKDDDVAGEAATTLPLTDLVEPPPRELLDGSARIALQVTPAFDHYIFIDQKQKHVRELQRLKTEFPRASIDIRRGDANEEIQDICSKVNWASRRAVLFLDPYGMQVEWETIVAIATTKAIDLWLLFPLGIGVNRLATRSGDIPESWQRRLDLLLGTPAWRDEFYATDTQRDLFGHETTRIIKKSVDTIGRYCNDRLRTVFAGVADKPAVLKNSVGNPLYMFCFAAANERGAKPALQIANSLLKGLS